MKTALVTGGRGFVGRHFVQHLEASGWDVTVIDIIPPPAKIDVPPGASYISGGVSALTVFKYEVKQYDLVVHAAAVAPNRKGIDLYKNAFPRNVMLDSTLFDWAYRTAQPRVVYLSSCAVYSPELRHPTLGGDVASMKFPFTEDMGFMHEPFDHYGQTKRIGERMAAAINEIGGTTVTVVRPFSGYGSDQSTDFPFAAFIQRVKNREDPFKIWGNGGQVRDWIHIDDIVEGTMALVEAKVKMPVNLCTGRGTSMRQLAEKMFLAAEIGGGYDPLIACDAAEPNGADYRVGDPTLLHEFYTPKVSLNEGIMRALRGK